MTECNRSNICEHYEIRIAKLEREARGAFTRYEELDNKLCMALSYISELHEEGWGVAVSRERSIELMEEAWHRKYNPQHYN